MTLEEIGQKVRQARQAARLSQPELATLADVSRALVAKLETGRLGEMGFTKLLRVLNAVNLDLRLSDLNVRRPTLEDLVYEDEEGEV